MLLLLVLFLLLLYLDVVVPQVLGQLLLLVEEHLDCSLVLQRGLEKIHWYENWRYTVLCKPSLKLLQLMIGDWVDP